jgi:alkyl sulfatase BDS1-like metallo-beta-lactamase superfamily hydrolase
MNLIPASFDPATTATGPLGQRAHPASIDHSQRLEEKLYKLGDKAWSMVGNGLSNQSFVLGPEGLIVIDTGECIEEMNAALLAIRQETSAPIVACIYTHFHYVGGTQALLDESGNPALPIYGHSGIAANLTRFGGEVGPRGARGLVHQFAVSLPTEGEDGLVNVGLGRFFRNPEHAPFTKGYIPAQHTFSDVTTLTIAGLDVEIYPAPSDASDSITIWFPALGVAINNLLWPALFNVFAIRGEEYRDPRVLLTGLDQLANLKADYLLGAHGPPLQGSQLIDDSIIDARDAIQYLWDQTVRGANLGLTLDELTSFVQLPEHFQQRYQTQQFYGVAEHHVRQIYTGLFGWFDEDEAKLFPTPAPFRSRKLIDGFGGIDKVRGIIDQALADADYRWAIELSSWLVRASLNDRGRADAGETQDRHRLAAGLRGVAQGTTAANIRNWSLTRARELEGHIDIERLRGHRFRAADLLSSAPTQSVPVLKVLLVPERAQGLDESLCIAFDNGSQAGLRLRHQVAIPTQGQNADMTLTISHQHWAQMLGGKISLTQLLADGAVDTAGMDDRVKRFLSCFDLPSLQSEGQQM